MTKQERINQLIGDSSKTIWLVRLRGIMSPQEIAEYWDIGLARVKRALASLETRGIAYFEYNVNGWKLTEVR
jgi:hypothetical protein